MGIKFKAKEELIVLHQACYFARVVIEAMCYPEWRKLYNLFDPGMDPTSTQEHEEKREDSSILHGTNTGKPMPLAEVMSANTSYSVCALSRRSLRLRRWRWPALEHK